MALTTTPAGEIGTLAPNFSLLGTDGKYYSLADCSKKNGLLVMFICNHCPYVKAIITRLQAESAALLALEVGCVAICSNDATRYPEDSYQNMQLFAQEHQFAFPYLWDETQAVAKAYDAVCTPDFFGYNAALMLQYRGRLDGGGLQSKDLAMPRELLEAFKTIIATGQGPAVQHPSYGCSIKWRD